MSDVFLSYSRKDTQFVREIFEALSARKREAWIDLHGIEYSTKWWDEICAGIDGSDNFVFFVSPNSLESLYCHREIQHALKHHKRIIPCLFHQVDQAAMFHAWQASPDISKEEGSARENWAYIQTIQWIDFTKINDVDLAIDTLLKTVDTDPERVKLHTRLLLRLRDWESSGRNPSGLLRGDELTLYEQWFNESRQKSMPPNPTGEQAAYIAESRRAQNEADAKRIQRERLVRRFRTASAVLGVFLVLAVIATVMTLQSANQAVEAQNASIAREGQANTQVALSGVTLQAGSTLIAGGHTQVAVSGKTLTPIPPTLTAVAQTVVAGSYMIESLNLSAEANALLRSNEGNAETAALLSIRVLHKLYLPSADSALVEAISRLRSVPQVYDVHGFNTSVAFSPDGKSFLSGYCISMELGGAELRDTATGAVIWLHEQKPPCINSVAFSPDGKRIVAAGSDNTAMIWDAATGKPERVLEGHNDAVLRALFSPDGKSILTVGGGKDLTARMWDAATGKQIFSGPNGGGFAAPFFYPDGKTFYSAGNIGSTSNGQIYDSGGMGGALAISPDGKTYVTGIDPVADLLDISSRNKIRSFTGHTDSIDSAAFSSDGKWLVTGSRDNTARIWEVDSGKLLMTLLSATAGDMQTVAFSPDGTKVLTGSKTVRLWSMTSDDPQQQTIFTPAGVSAFALSPDGKIIIAGDVGGNINLWNLATKQLIFPLFKNNYDVKAVAYSPDGKMVAFAIEGDLNNSKFGVFDTTTGTMIKSFNTESLQPYLVNLTFSSDSKMLFAALHDDTARLWDIASGKVLREFNGNDPLNHGFFSYSPDGKFLSIDGGMIWWDISAGEQIKLPDEMKGNKSVFSDDGSLIAFMNNQGQPIAVWNVSTRQIVNRVGGSNNQVTSMAISTDNKLLLTGNQDNAVRLWEISTGRLLRVYSGHTAAVTSVAFLPGGQKIITGSMDGTIRTWITDYNDLLDYACTRIGKDLTPDERSRYGISDQEPICPQFGTQAQPLMPTTTPMPTRTPPPAWTPMPTPTPGNPKP
jgi:WD40 repeat protein